MHSRIQPYTEDDLSTTKNGPVDVTNSDGSVLTVWKRSSMTFQGTDGFTVFDNSGRLAFRVDNYSRKRSGRRGLVLMDGSGTPLLTFKPHSQMMRMQDQWNGYRGEVNDETSLNHGEFTMRARPRSGLICSRSKSRTKEHYEAEVFMGGRPPKNKKSISQMADFRVEGSFWRRKCMIKTSSGALAAKITRKRSANQSILLSDEVFSLVVQPGFNPELIMGFVVVLDRICTKPFAPLFCSSWSFFVPIAHCFGSHM